MVSLLSAVGGARKFLNRFEVLGLGRGPDGPVSRVLGSVDGHGSPWVE
jgi:hypothetical protein